MNGILWRTRSGAPWRDLPEQYGSWKTVYGRHRTWSADGTWDRVLRALQRGSDSYDAEWLVSVDSTVIRAHHHAAGARTTAPADVPADRLAVAFAATLEEVACSAEPDLGGRIESQGFTA